MEAKRFRIARCYKMIPQEILFKEAYVILQTAKNMPNEINSVIDLVVENAGKNKHIIITGVGKNADIAEKMASTYSSIGIPSFYLDAYEALHGDLGMVVKDQLVIAYSKSGNTEELSSAFIACGKKGAKLVSITCNKDSDLGKISTKYNGIDVVLDCEFEADEHNLAPTCSSTLFLAIGDSIGCTASWKLKFSKEDFLTNHPGGSLGSMLKKELESK